MQDNKEMVKFATRYVDSFKGAVENKAFMGARRGGIKCGTILAKRCGRVKEKGVPLRNVVQGAFSEDIYSTWHYQPPTNPEQAGSEVHLCNEYAMVW